MQKVVCVKCGYVDKNCKVVSNIFLCGVCSVFAPKNTDDLQAYVSESIDWKLLETFRKVDRSFSKRSGMGSVAAKGLVVSRPPLGYDVREGLLIPNEDASRVHSLFKTFLNRKYSLNSLAKNFSLSTNGLKKVLSNRTYLGEVKFAGKLHKGGHEPLISQEIFYAVQRKLQEYLRPKKG